MCKVNLKYKGLKLFLSFFINTTFKRLLKKFLLLSYLKCTHMINDKNLEKYISEHTSDEDPLLTELDRATNLRVVQPRMISGHVQGKLLEMFARMLSPRYILEIGTFTGYSALCLAKGLTPDGELHTIEINDELEDISSGFFARSGHASQITQHIGSALDIAPGLGKVFDLVFIDGDKREYVGYYDMLMDGGLVRSGTVMIADNVLWYGKILEDIPANDLYTKGIAEFNDKVRNDPRAENVIVPVRDGMTLIRVL